MLRSVTASQPCSAEGKHNIMVAAALLLACLAIAMFPRSVAADKGDLAQIKEAIEHRELHWTAEEYGRTFPLGLLPKAELAQLDEKLPRITEMAGLPATIDWRNNGGNFVSPAKDQQYCGSCWAFAPVAALEARYCIAANTPDYFLDLSEQTLLSCVSSYYGCNGGDPTAAAEFLRTQGAPMELCFPYTASKDNCANACANWQEQAFKITGYTYVEPTIGALKTALLQGPLQVAMNVYSDFYYYRSGVYEYASGSDMGGHAVLAVGYVDTPGQYGGGYFIVKNSWGPGWGENGFFKIGYNQMTGQVAFGHLGYAYTVDTPTDTWPTLPPDLWVQNFGRGAGGWTSQDKYPRCVADVNGDGLADVVGFANAGVYVSLSTGTSFGSPTRWIASYGYSAGGWTSQDKYPRCVADVNGDGKADVVGFANGGVYVSLSTGSSFAAPELWIRGFGVNAGGWASQGQYPRLVADVTGDGRADIVGFGNGGVYVAPSTGTSFATTQLWLQDFGISAGGWSSQDLYPRVVADFDGDGKADIVGFKDVGACVALSSSSRFGTPVLQKVFFGTSGGWASYDWYPRIVADLNGDGKADITGFGQAGVFVSLTP